VVTVNNYLAVGLAASAENFERELNLPRGSRSPADLAEARAEDGVGGQTHVHDVEDVEELGAELDVEEFAAAGAAFILL
jgi:hypothetical protein